MVCKNCGYGHPLIQYGLCQGCYDDLTVYWKYRRLEERGDGNPQPDDRHSTYLKAGSAAELVSMPDLLRAEELLVNIPSVPVGLRSRLGRWANDCLTVTVIDPTHVSLAAAMAMSQSRPLRRTG